jgi:hypothetical protein
MPSPADRFYEVVHGTQTVQYEVRQDFGFAAPVAVPFAKRMFALADAEQSDSQLTMTQAVWYLWVLPLAGIKPKRGDRLTDAEGTVWLLESAQRSGWDSSYRCVAHVSGAGTVANGGAPLAAILLEDFSGAAVRKNWDGNTALWQLATGPQTLTGGFDALAHDFNGTVAVHGGGASSGIFKHFQPRGDLGGFPFPQGYMHYYVQGGAWSSAYNRLRFKITCTNQDIPRRADGGDHLQIGAYIKDHADSDVNTQGPHYYWQMDPSWYAGEPAWIYLPPQLQHQVTLDPNRNWPYEPELQNGSSRVWEGMTNWYYDGDPFGGGSPNGSTWIWDDYYFEAVDAASEPIVAVQGSGDPAPVTMQLVSGIHVIYNPGAGRFELTWAGPKNMEADFRIAYKTSSMKVAGGWDSGVWDGTTVSGNTGAYTGRFWQSPVLARQAMFFGIKPLTSNPSGYFTEVMYRG